MTGPQHYREAERLLAVCAGEARGTPLDVACAAAAAVHAALAQTAIDALTQGVCVGAVHINRVRPWLEAIGIFETGEGES